MNDVRTFCSVFRSDLKFHPVVLMLRMIGGVSLILFSGRTIAVKSRVAPHWENHRLPKDFREQISVVANQISATASPIPIWSILFSWDPINIQQCHARKKERKWNIPLPWPAPVIPELVPGQWDTTQVTHSILQSDSFPFFSFRVFFSGVDVLELSSY